MLKNIHIENYKSLKNVTVEFKDGLNIIIGKNGSGKSNLLEYIDSKVQLSFFVDWKIDRKQTDSNFTCTYISQDIDGKFELAISILRERDINIEEKQNNSFTKIQAIKNYELAETPSERIEVLLSDNQEDSNFDGIGRIRNFFLKNLSLFFVQKVKFNIPHNLLWLDYPNTYTYDIRFNEINAFNNTNKEEISITSYLHAYLQSEFVFSTSLDFSSSFILTEIKDFIFKHFDSFKTERNIDENLKLYSPINAIRINPNVNIYRADNSILIENLVIDFSIENTWVPWNYLSDGTKRLFYLITTISCQEQGLVLIEEPELGIHPHQLFLLMNFIKEQSENKQIIVSTHSPVVLDILNADELDKITIAKIGSGSSSFHNLTEEQKEKAGVYMTEVADLSDYWLHSDLEA